MKVQLKILKQTRGSYCTDAYETGSQARVFLGKYQGTIPEIKKELENEYNQEVAIESSVFQGWY